MLNRSFSNRSVAPCPMAPAVPSRSAWFGAAVSAATSRSPELPVPFPEHLAEARHGPRLGRGWLGSLMVHGLVGLRDGWLVGLRTGEGMGLGDGQGSAMVDERWLMVKR